MKAIKNNNEPDVIYTDEDKMSMNGMEYYEPHFKSGFNKELLRSNNYICHFFVVKKEVINRIGGFRKEFEGAQDYDVQKLQKKLFILQSLFIIGGVMITLQQKIQRANYLLMRVGKGQLKSN